jgi:2-polyprenyl-3-methyl-5-hydroxy-6-metoxy-1,4-benzoquinol methylase
MEKTLTDHHGQALGSYGEYQLIACDPCGFIHVDPLPTESELATVYDEKFYAEDKPQYLTKMEQERPYWDEAVYRYRYDIFEKFLGNVPGNILDVGCSGGFFLRYGQERGWRVQGVEPSRQAAAYAKTILGVEIIQDYFQHVLQTSLPENLNVIHMQFVLEHLPNPIEICRKAYELLKPGGILCIEVPNDFNPTQQLLHEQQGLPEYWVSIPHHLNYFNRASLSGLLERIGFQIAHEEASFPMEFFLLMGENYVGNDEIGASCHQRRMHLEQTLAKTPESRALRNRLYQAMAEMGIGRTLTVFAQKL